MKHIVIGTAGHVDHGKTALIKRLTGIDTDRLKEEKERGITIELGFASLLLPGGQRVGIVDVPGHERFVKNMVAGAAGIDLVTMVIAADEGVMPQTREHLQICSLLGIRKGVVVITKIDLVDKDWLGLVREDIRAVLKGTFLGVAPIVPVSSVTGEGVPELITAIERSVYEVSESPEIGILRLPVDRVFTMKGFGTVVTGTLISGSVTVGEEIEIFPVGIHTKVRGIQVHNEAVRTAEAGQRTAVNLQGVDKDDIERGSVLANPGKLKKSNRLDCLYSHLSSSIRKIKNRTIVRFHLGTSEIMARLILFGREDLGPKEHGFAQFVLDAPVTSVAGDRFVIRSYSPVTTIGGGVIVDPLPAKHKRMNSDLLKEFELLAGEDEIKKIEVIIKRAGIRGITMDALVVRVGINKKRLLRLLEDMFLEGKAILVDRDEMQVLSPVVFDDFKAWIVDALDDYHKQHPFQEGLAREELRTTHGVGCNVEPKIFSIALNDLEKKGEIVIERDMIRLKDHQVNLDEPMGNLREKLTEVYLKGKMTPPTVREVNTMFSDHKKEIAILEKIMLQEGELIRISEELNFHRDVLSKLREDYRTMLIENGEATPASFRNLTGLSRKFIIPLMEYFDMIKLTMRVGDKRILRERIEK
jgi:selenocysteine-specific elongation factor